MNRFKLLNIYYAPGGSRTHFWTLEVSNNNRYTTGAAMY